VGEANSAGTVVFPHGGGSPFLIRTSALKWFVLAAMLMAGLGIRLYRISDPPLHFWPNREFRSYLIARTYYFRSLKDLPLWERQIAETNMQAEGLLEPPLLEHVTAFAYQIAGRESPSIPRIFSSVFWVVGGVFVYLVARRYASLDAAIVSVGFYLFLPYGVIATRGFQPDPLMVMTLLASVHAIVRYFDRPSNWRLVMAGVLAGLTIFIKATCLFPVFGAFLSLAMFHQGFRKTILSASTLVFFALALTPALYYVYGLFIARFLQAQSEMSFMPSLLVHPRFWLNWLAEINVVVGIAALGLALMGFFWSPSGELRALLAGWSISYFVYGLVFDYHISTHDYYQLPLIPLIALALAPLAQVALEQIATLGHPLLWRTAAVAALVAGALFALAGARARLYNPADRVQVTIAEAIGEAVNHSRSIILGSDYVRPLEYYGELSVVVWPSNADFQWEQLLGVFMPNARERFDTISEAFQPDFFIVRSFAELDKQSDLKSLLVRGFPVVVQTKDYEIFDLRPR
jgi:hypothetical protein